MIQPVILIFDYVTLVINMNIKIRQYLMSSSEADGLIMHVCFKCDNTILNGVLTVGNCKFIY